MNNPRHISEILPGVINDLLEISREPERLTNLDALTIELPFPPSVNTFWRHVMIGKHPRTLISEKGRKYKQAVLEHFLIENIRTKFSGPLSCTVDLYPPCNRRRDCDNYCKGLLDSLGAAGLYDDDSQIIDLHIRMHPKRAPGSVRVTLQAISAEHCAHNQMELMASGS